MQARVSGLYFAFAAHTDELFEIRIKKSGRYLHAGVRGATALRPKILHPPDHPLDMRDRGFRQDAVAEIEDQPSFRVVRQHIVDRAIERRAARDQRQRIEIALHGSFGLHPLADQ
jgi:hypothetical protein